MGIPLKLVPPRDRYLHGWGQECHGAKPIVCTWELTVQDINRKSCTLYFDLVNGSSPLVMGLDVGRYSDTVNQTDKSHIRMQRPQDTTLYVFNTYILPDSQDNPDCIRVRVELLPRCHSSPRHRVTSMLSKLYKQVERGPQTFAKRVHRFTHVHPDQLKNLCASAGILNADVEHAIDTVDSACEICTRNGRLLPSKKGSLSHVNEAFNEEIQIDFKYLIVYRPDKDNPEKMHREKYILLVFTDTGTKYTEAVIVDHRNIESIIQTYEKSWLCRHGASRSLSADDEYNKPRLKKYLNTHGVTFKARPTRRHNKLGIVERKNQSLAKIIQRIAMENSSAPMSTIVARGTFLCNLFAGSQSLSAFELARGYQPSLLGIPSTQVTQELLDAHTHQVATRALQRVLRSRTPNIPTPGMFKPDDIVWVWFSTSKQNEDDRWIKATVVQAHKHLLEVRRKKDGKPCKGPTMKPAYEDVRVAPRNQLAQELMFCTLENALGYSESSERGVEPRGESDNGPRNAVSSMMTTKGPPRTKEGKKKSAEDDIGEYAHEIIHKNPNITTTLKSERARIIDRIYEQVGTHQVSRGKLEQAPPWILDEAFDKEYQANWVDSFILVDEKDVPPDANIISSHTQYTR